MADHDTVTAELLEDRGLHLHGSYPLMVCELAQLQEITYKDFVTVSQVTQRDELMDCVAIIAHIFHYSAPEFAQTVDNLSACGAPGAITFYQGLYKDQRAATAMVIHHSNTISMHWVCTLEAYRGHGLAYAITDKALRDAYNQGYTHALLMASDQALSMYKKFGFQDHAYYKIYQKM